MKKKKKKRKGQIMRMKKCTKIHESAFSTGNRREGSTDLLLYKKWFEYVKNGVKSGGLVVSGRGIYICRPFLYFLVFVVFFLVFENPDFIYTLTIFYCLVFFLFHRFLFCICFLYFFIFFIFVYMRILIFFKH